MQVVETSAKPEKGSRNVALLLTLTTCMTPNKVPQHNEPYVFSPGSEGNGVTHL